MPPQTAEAGPSDELAEKYATLLATLAMELLECWKRAENGVQLQAKYRSCRITGCLGRPTDENMAWCAHPPLSNQVS